MGFSCFWFNYSTFFMLFLIIGEEGIEEDYDSTNEEFNLMFDWLPFE